MIKLMISRLKLVVEFLREFLEDGKQYLWEEFVGVQCQTCHDWFLRKCPLKFYVACPTCNIAFYRSFQGVSFNGITPFYREVDNLSKLVATGKNCHECPIYAKCLTYEANVV